MFKYLRFWVAALVLPLVVVGAHASRLPAPGCTAPYRVDAHLKTQARTIDVEVTKSPAELARGLSGRACISSDQAKLFEFNRPGYYQFWMKEMHFSIDMVWLDSNWRVVTVRSSVLPKTYPQTFTSSRPAQYVLELTAGRAFQLGISEGSLLQP